MTRYIFATFLILIFFHTRSFSISSDTLSVKEYDSFILNGVECYSKAADNIIVTVAVERVKQFGSFFRLKLVIVNLRDKRVDFLMNNVKAELTYDGIGYDADVLSYDKFMRKVRAKRFFFGDVQKIIDNPLSAIYPIDPDDISSSLYGNKWNNQKNYDVKSNLNDSLRGDIVHNEISKIINSGGMDRTYSGDNIGVYKLLMDRAYLQSNTLYPMCAIGGIVMIKRRPGSDFILNITIDGTDFDFKWKIDNIKEIKYF